MDDITNRKKVIRLGYLQTMKAVGGEFDFAKAGAGATQGTTRELGDTENIYIPGSDGRQAGSAAIQRSTQLIDTGWVKGPETLVEKTDRARVAVGIRDILIGESKFKEQSVFVTREYKTVGRIKSLSIESNEAIPDAFPDGEYIIYEASFSGETWTKIVPLAGKGNPKKIVVNGDAGDNEVKVDGGEDPHSFRLRVTMKRPEGATYAGSSPVLRSFRILVETL
jgi:hypothetical protein